MGEASPGWRSTTLDTDPVAERTHTALEDWFAKAAIFAATSSEGGTVMMCGVKLVPAEPANALPTAEGDVCCFFPVPGGLPRRFFCAGSSIPRVPSMSGPDMDEPILGGALTRCCCCCAAAFMVPSGPYLRGLPLFRLTGSAGAGAGGTVPEAEAETEPMVLLCINGGGAVSIWNCMPAREPPPMELRIAVALMFMLGMLGMGRMTECMPASEDGLWAAPPASAARCCCCCWCCW